MQKKCIFNYHLTIILNAFLHYLQSSFTYEQLRTDTLKQETTVDIKTSLDISSYNNLQSGNLKYK